jgi:hypothetical protein
MCFYAALHYVEAYAAWQGDDIYQLYSCPNGLSSTCNESNLGEVSQSRGLTQHQRYQSYVDDIAADNGWDELPVAYERLRRGSEKARYLKHIKVQDKTSGQHFILGADFYIEKLQIVKSELQISSIKASIQGN